MFKKINLSDNLPKHIAIIMDGNGRWATKRGLPRTAGHKEGILAISRTIDALLKTKIKYVTFFAFSTENWKRSKDEIDTIFDLIRNYIKENKNDFDAKGVKICSIGDLSKFPKDLVQSLEEAKEKTKNNSSLVVTLALNYGGRDEITRAANLAFKAKKGEITIQDIWDNLDSSLIGLPEPDFVIRTSGEMRVSNFMIFQMAYSELYFPKVLWPDFDEKQLFIALNEYSKRERRFGGIK